MKNKQSKGLSLSANPISLNKGTFFAATKVFAEFFKKINKLSPRLSRRHCLTYPAEGEVKRLLRFTRNDNRVRSEVGRSMIEMLGVLAIIAVLSVGGIAGYSKAMSSFKHNKWRQQIEDLIFNIKDAYKNERNYGSGSDNILPTLKSMNVVPQDMLDENDKDLFGNKVSVVMRDYYGDGKWVRVNLQFNMQPRKENVQVCHDLLYLVPTYTKYIWVTGVCAGKCNSGWLYRICGNAAPDEYWATEKCDDYNLAAIMSACQVCATQSCTALVLFDNNA